jgi:threonine synthase|tara:strand:+ start:91 stop:2163 length:2073 start_codon:yes stop_codon:yes gene_type:complete
MRYVSNRGGSPKCSLLAASLLNLPNDGGLFVPQTIPKVTPVQLKRFRSLGFQDLAFEILRLFITETDVPKEKLRTILRKCYKGFDESDVVVPLVVLDEDDDTDDSKKNKSKVQIHVAELFHGPTLSVKDISLAFAVQMIEYFLTKKHERANVIVVTTGDTGPATLDAIEKFGNNRIDCWCLYPSGKISKAQERQMTTKRGENVSAIEVKECERGCDDIDDVCANIFKDEEFVQRNGITSLNSCNILRILAQLPHFFWCYFRTMHGKTTEEDIENHTMTCVVPTGAMGHAFTAQLAREMGLPMTEVVLATNANGAIHEIAMTGEIVKKSKAEETFASAMDCVMPYNLWRPLYYCAEEDTEILRRIQDTYEFYGHATLPKKVLRNFRETFLTAEVSDYDTLRSMKYNFNVHKYLPCPHTAVALHAAREMGLNNHEGENALVVLATAHPAKFTDAVQTAFDFEASDVPRMAKHKIIEDAKMSFQRKRETNLENLEIALRTDIETTSRARRGKYVNLTKERAAGVLHKKYLRGNEPAIPAFAVSSQEHRPSSSSQMGEIRSSPSPKNAPAASSTRIEDQDEGEVESKNPSKTKKELEQEQLQWNRWTRRFSFLAAIISFALVVRDPNRQRDIPFVDGFGKKAASFIEAKKKEIASRIEKKREEKRLSALAKPSVYIRERVGKARPANPAFDVAR